MVSRAATPVQPVPAWMTSIRCWRSLMSLGVALIAGVDFLAAEDFLVFDLVAGFLAIATDSRSEEHTSELQSLMRLSYAVFCLKKKKNNTIITSCTTTLN